MLKMETKSKWWGVGDEDDPPPVPSYIPEPRYEAEKARCPELPTIFTTDRSNSSTRITFKSVTKRGRVITTAVYSLRLKKR